MSVSQEPDARVATVLDNPAWHSLTGPHAHLAEGEGRARRYRPDVSPFHGVEDHDDPQAWRDLAELVGVGGEALLTGTRGEAPDGWELAMSIPGVQLVETDRVRPVADEEAVRLGEADVEDMIALVRATKPGPFETSTHLMGTYLGIRREGRLVAMAGQRMAPPGWVEISAVCTAPDHRGQGLAGRLVLAVTDEIHRRGDRALLHAAASNTGAIEVYRRLGFELRRRTTFEVYRAPAPADAPARRSLRPH